MNVDACQYTRQALLGRVFFPSHYIDSFCMIKKFIFWPLFFTCQLLTLALLSWHLMAQFHFAYPLGYQWLGLGETIAKFSPLNRYKRDFEFTSQSEHWRLFGEISDAIQSSGKGLAEISYTLQDGRPTALMHEAEIVHLQDVANLVDGFYRLGFLALILWGILVFIVYQRKMEFPATRRILAGFMVGLAAIAAVLWGVGPKKLFYWLHVQVFPDGHQWFFYYNESLMTTLMKAPDIFAFIGLLLLLSFALFWFATLWGLKKLLPGRLR